MKWFWAVVSSFTQEELARLLQFTTGSSQLPPGGFNTLCPSFQIIAAPTHSTLPTAHTWWVGKRKQKQMWGFRDGNVSWSTTLVKFFLPQFLSSPCITVYKIIRCPKNNFWKMNLFSRVPITLCRTLCALTLLSLDIFTLKKKSLQFPHISVLWSHDFCLYGITVCQRCEHVSNEFHPCMR